MEAAYEVSRQIRLRDLSGIMIIDFIDMVSHEALEFIPKGKLYGFDSLMLDLLDNGRTVKVNKTIHTLNGNL